jgi:2-methylcitrate dehydratase PrpD
VTLLVRIGGLADEIARSEAPAEIREKAKAHLLDSLVMMAAAREHPLTLQAGDLRMPFGAGGAVAFRAGVACDALGLDDFDEETRTHPGAVVVAALLGGIAAGEQPVSGPALMAGVLAGYEVVCRFGEVAGASSLHDRGFHPSAVCGVLGAAAGLSVTLGRAATAGVGLAASLAGGVFELDGRGALKGLQTGWAASGAVAAVAFADAGYAPAATVLDGPKGLLRALGREDRGEETASAALAGPMRISRVSFKPYSHFTDLHPATAALLALLRDEEIDVADLDAIEVHLPAGVGPRLNDDFPPRATRLARRDPRFALAAAACRADPRSVADPLLDAFGEAALEDPGILDLARRVSWSDDLPRDGGAPAAVVTLHVRGGRHVAASATGYPGDGRRDEHRWGWDEVARRSASLEPGMAPELVSEIAAIEQLGDARPLAARLAACLGAPTDGEAPR